MYINNVVGGNNEEEGLDMALSSSLNKHNPSGQVSINVRNTYIIVIFEFYLALAMKHTCVLTIPIDVRTIRTCTN